LVGDAAYQLDLSKTTTTTITINSEEEVEDVRRSLLPVSEWRGEEKWSERGWLSMRGLEERRWRREGG
jgi:hypothetical protein